MITLTLKPFLENVVCHNSDNVASSALQFVVIKKLHSQNGL